MWANKKKETPEISKEWVDSEANGYGGFQIQRTERSKKNYIKNVHNELQWLLELNQRKGKLKHCTLRCALTENKQTPNCFQQRRESRTEVDLS
jgi:hypothetical protein